MLRKTPQIAFSLYRWTNPETRCEHPFLAVAEDRSATLELGDYCFSLEAGVPAAHARWLEQDFVLTDTLLTLDLLTIRQKIHAAFLCDADFIAARFDASLQPMELELSLPMHDTQTEGPEFILTGPSRYQRIYREPLRAVPVTMAEHAMLDVFYSAFTDLASRHSQVLTAPLPPRFRWASELPPIPEGRTN
jgi:hypothetical protein